MWHTAAAPPRAGSCGRRGAAARPWRGSRPLARGRRRRCRAARAGRARAAARRLLRSLLRSPLALRCSNRSPPVQGKAQRREQQTTCEWQTCVGPASPGLEPCVAYLCAVELRERVAKPLPGRRCGGLQGDRPLVVRQRGLELPAGSQTVAALQGRRGHRLWQRGWRSVGEVVARSCWPANESARWSGGGCGGQHCRSCDVKARAAKGGVPPERALPAWRRMHVRRGPGDRGPDVPRGRGVRVRGRGQRGGEGTGPRRAGSG